VSFLLYDEVYEEQALSSIDLMTDTTPSFSGHSIPSLLGADVLDVLKQIPQSQVHAPAVDTNAVAYLHHTSGTSSGLPKPIPQPHRAAVCVLPHLPPKDSEPAKATFTTTPLYHGGIADLFRAWTSDAPIYLFPGKEVPITATNIIRCLDAAAQSEDPPVKYFSSVPYVLQMLEADSRGLQYLQRMDIVGVGGAALPPEVGDRMVKKGVNLVSRFGSAECGFLLSSHRDYAADKEWQYLRTSSSAEPLRFEPQIDGSGTHELVIQNGWPHMAKRNRDDGSFATSDLFLPHESIEGAWRYHSRADAQLTLITGKKFDPAPLEGTITDSTLVSDALIFGNGRPFPGVLIFRSKDTRDAADEEMMSKIWPLVERLNAESQDHARIPRSMIMVMPYKESNLEKSSKGTVMRGKAEERYAEDIERAYDASEPQDNEHVEDEDVASFIKKSVKDIMHKKTELTDDTDLFSYGMDSVACMQLRSRMRSLLEPQAGKLPMSVVEDHGSVRKLSAFVVNKRHGQEVQDEEDEEQLMRDLVKRYGAFEGTSSTNDADGEFKDDNKRETIALTGATGALGAHILNIYRTCDRVAKVYCLVRGADEHAARERISKALTQRGLEDLSSASVNNEKVVVLQAQLSHAHLGLSEEMYETLARQATAIVHVAWAVNFRLRLQSFVKDHIAGRCTRNQAAVCDVD